MKALILTLVCRTLSSFKVFQNIFLTDRRSETAHSWSYARISMMKRCQKRYRNTYRNLGLGALIFLGMNLMTHAQNPGVITSTFGIQTGPIGIWLHNESRISPTIALRSEIGLNMGISNSILDDYTTISLTPEITIEPRWYYNLQERVDKSKRTEGNSGNFISLHTSYQPDWFTISNNEKYGTVRRISIIPTWGIRRNLGQHLTFEAGLGVGYQHRLGNFSGDGIRRGEVGYNIHLRFGYRF